MSIKPEIMAVAGVTEDALEDGRAGELYLDADEKGFEGAVSSLSLCGYNLISLFCAENFRRHPGFTLFYAFEKAGHGEVLVMRRRLQEARTTSIEGIYPSACWWEREVRDGFGIEFDGAFDTRRLFLHETYPEGFHPLLKSFKNHKIKARTDLTCESEYRFKEVSGEAVYQIPVGPVHAGIIEPGHFRFSVIGETIFNLEIRMFYKHRGAEKLAEGKSPQECLNIAEAISGDETVANAVAFCNAIEKMSGITVPQRAWHMRTVLLETERIYSHLSDLAGMIIDVAYPAGASPLHILREEVLRHNASMTSSRFMKGAVAIGGMRQDITHKPLADYSRYLEGFTKRFDEAIEAIESSPSVIDRLEGTGIIKPDLVAHLNITGPAARASGAHLDTRTNHPYGIYGQLKPHMRLAKDGDVMARFNVKAMEVRDSTAMIRKLIHEMPPHEAERKHEISDGCALSLVEAPRGQNLQFVSVRGGHIDRFKVRTASFCNWQAIEHAVLGNIVPDFPLINKSLNLSYAGTDL